MDNVGWSHADSYFLSFVSDVLKNVTLRNVYLDSLSVKQNLSLFSTGDECVLNAKCWGNRDRGRRSLSRAFGWNVAEQYQIMMVFWLWRDGDWNPVCEALFQ